MRVLNLCRICLGEDAQAMQPLFDDSLKAAEIVQQIEECGGIELKPLEDFPNMICLQCLDYLNTSSKFRSMCQSSEHALLDIIVKSEMKVEPHDPSVSMHSETHEDEIFLDLNSEFITAKEVDFIEITGGDDNDIITEVGESDEEFLITSITESEDNISDDDDDDDEDIAEEDVDQEQEINENIMTSTIIARRRVQNNRKPYTVCRSGPTSTTGHVKRLQRQYNTDHDGTAGSSLLTFKKSRKHKKDVLMPASIMCEICGNIYTKRSLLNMHMRRHMAQKPFECEICGKTFACPSEIGRHIRVHTGEKPYVCKYCGRTFADRSTNIKHERIHTNERPFSCKTCGKSFTYSNVLKNHMLTHTGEKPFPCLACNKTFSRKHQLDQHCSTLTHQQTVKNLHTLVTSDNEVIVGDLMSVAEMAEITDITD